MCLAESVFGAFRGMGGKRRVDARGLRYSGAIYWFLAVNVVVTTNSGKKTIFIVFDLWTLAETMEN